MNKPKSKTSDTTLISRPMAVIDIGSTAIRMTIAQIDKAGIVHTLEALQQPLTLGRDTFTKGYIKKSSIEECVRALKKFQRVLDEYQITGDERIRNVATTAVREATNRDSFIDRIFIANGMNVEVVDEVDVARLTYLSVRAHLSIPGFPSTPDVLATEMSGGTTELLLMQNSDVIQSKTYRLGALRLHEMLEAFRTPVPRQRELMEGDINRTVDQIRQMIFAKDSLTMLALGGDMRFAASKILPDWNHTDPVKIPTQQLQKFTSHILSLSIDEIVHDYHLTFSESETLGPSLLYYVKLAHAFNLKHIIASDISMRHGLFVEMSLRGAWSDDFSQQIIRSAIDIGRKFRFDETHAKQVAYLSSILFKSLTDEHRLDRWYELLLTIAALLHDIGSFISIRSHHKHSMYLIQNSELFGLSRHDIQIIALIARYHRRSSPKPTHEEYMAIDRESRLTISKLAAILRVADALDRSNSQRIHDIKCKKEGDQLVIMVPDVDDLSLEELGIQSKGSMFEDVFGFTITLRKVTRAQL